MARKEVTTRTLQKLEATRVVQDYQLPVNALCFSQDSDLLLTSSNASSLHVYSILDEPRLLYQIEQPGGITHITATHYNPAVLYASAEPLVHYYDYHKEREIWTFRDFTQRVLSLAMCPTNDCFLSISAAHRLLCSDLRQRKSIFHCDLIEAEGTAACAFDPTGLVFGLSCPLAGQTSVKLFDVRNPTQGPFKTGEFEAWGSVTSMEFSENGDLVLVGTAMNRLLTAHAFSLRQMTCIDPGFPPEADSVAVFSGCSKYILSGCTASGNLQIYEAETGQLVWEVQRGGTVQAVAWNRHYFLFVSAARTVDFWTPNLTDSE